MRKCWQRCRSKRPRWRRARATCEFWSTWPCGWAVRLGKGWVMGKATEGQGGAGEFRRGLMLYGSTAAIAAALMLAEGGVGPAMAQEIGPRISPSYSAQGDFTVPGPTPSPSFEYRSST